MIMKFFDFIRRPVIDDQTTETLVYQRSNQLARTSVNGIGGQGVRRCLAPVQGVTLVVGNTLVKRDPTQTGNTSKSPVVTPLTDNSSIANI